MQNKKAISALVATVLLVLITVAVVGLIWGAVIPMINTGMEESTAKQECLKTGITINLEGTGLSGTPPAQTVTVNVGREDSTANVSKVLVKATNATGISQTFQCTTVPQVFGNSLCAATTTISGISKVDVLAYVRVGTKDYPCSSVGEVAI